MIKVEGLTKRYARAVAVDNISFEVGKGQIVGFLGPNGAGKTTTMRMLTGFLPPTAGRAEVAGFDVVERPNEVKQRIGYLPETPPLYPEMEVGDYLRFVAKLKGVHGKEVQARVDDAARRCAVDDVKGKLIGKLSKGYKQRVGLAQAIIHNPDVLILDEPTSGLDPKQINETRDLIRSLAGEHTIVLSTHILPEVEAMCERVIIIARGRVVATDTMDSLRQRMRGAEALLVEVEGHNGATLDPAAIQQRLELVPGISRVTRREAHNGRHGFDIELLPGKVVRGDIARSIVEAGWDLVQLRTAGASLEEIFLQLTSGNAPAPASTEVSE